MDPEIISKLAGLPLQLQVIAAGGYCAYRLSYVGIGHSHRATDTIFSTLAFGLVAALGMLLTARGGPIVSASCGFALALVAGAIWRLWLRGGLRRVLRWSGYSWSDDSPSAWDHLLANSQYGPTQITVELDDGRYLLCTNATRAGEAPFGPYVLGTNGDVLMYVDQSIGSDGALREVPSVYDRDWGDLVTYVPRERIRKISIRQKP